jgi:hypothetical protein
VVVELPSGNQLPGQDFQVDPIDAVCCVEIMAILRVWLAFTKDKEQNTLIIP